MAKFRTACDDAQDIIQSKGVKNVPYENLQVGQTYFSLGLNGGCHPCVTVVRYLGLNTNEGEYKGRPLIESDGIVIVTDIDDLNDMYDNTFTNLSVMQSACKEVYDNWCKAVKAQTNRLKTA